MQNRISILGSHIRFVQNFTFITPSKLLSNKYNFCKIFILIINLQFINAFLYCLVPVLVLQIAKYLHITGCSDIDECTANTTYTSDYCNNLASCTNNVGSWTCTCNTGIPKIGIELNFSSVHRKAMAIMKHLLDVRMSMSVLMETFQASVEAIQTAQIMWAPIPAHVNLDTQPGKNTMDVETSMNAVKAPILSVLTLVKELHLIMGSASTLADLLIVEHVVLEELY